MTFWGCIVAPGSKPTPFVPAPNGDRLHISQARPPPALRRPRARIRSPLPRAALPGGNAARCARWARRRGRRVR